jgi:hypothetical protein
VQQAQGSEVVNQIIQLVQASGYKVVILLTGTAVSLDVLFSETGSNKLTLADTNEEGTNMLALQTRQQLSMTLLSLASQAAQSVLRLFG